MEKDPTPRGIPRPEGYMDKPYIGRDGRDYHSLQALREANALWHAIYFPKRFDPFTREPQKIGNNPNFVQ